jgi:cytochrome c peroxidase
MFFDTSLSAFGQQSCASCHDPRLAYGPPNSLAAQLGGPDRQRAGLRATPSLRYLENVPPFTEHYFDNDGDDSKDQGPTGGHDWDGRANSLHEQASGPLLSAFEIGNANEAEVVRKLGKANYAGQFRKVFGDAIFERPREAFIAATMALEVFQQTPAQFFPYSSRYDTSLRGQGNLNRQELRGLAAFNDPAKGNCASCHTSRASSAGHPRFTDFGYIALGVPRNPKLAANADPGYHDMGLCGPQRTDLAGKPEYCGLFRTPSLRNVAIRKSFFHNAAFHSLEEVLRF